MFRKKLFPIFTAFLLWMGGSLLAFAQITPGGQYVKYTLDSGGNTLCTSTILVTMDWEGEYLINLSSVKADGTKMSFSVKAGTDGGKIVCGYPDSKSGAKLEFDMYPTDGDGGQLYAVRVREIKGSGGAGVPEGFDIGGLYTKVMSTFTDKDGYMYRMIGPDKCELVFGGAYEGTVNVPERVESPLFGVVQVAGVGPGAMVGNTAVTGVKLSLPTQYITPGACFRTSIPFDDTSVAQPFLAYPMFNMNTFLIPLDFEETELKASIMDFSKQEDSRWAIFKQNYTLLGKPSVQGNPDEGSLWGRANASPGKSYALRYEATDKGDIASKMFRGYEAYEVELLVASSEWAAVREFPSFSRWKYPEPQVSADRTLEEQVEAIFRRKLKYSRKVANLRDGDGELTMYELEVKGNKATVVFVWYENGAICAMGNIDEEVSAESVQEGSSVWNVDDDGDYGIPNVVTIARRPDGGVDIYLVHPAPESSTELLLHQEGDIFEISSPTQWYINVE